jgi:hypothetical protein
MRRLLSGVPLGRPGALIGSESIQSIYVQEHILLPHSTTDYDYVITVTAH